VLRRRTKSSAEKASVSRKIVSAMNWAAHLSMPEIMAQPCNGALDGAEWLEQRRFAYGRGGECLERSSARLVEKGKLGGDNLTRFRKGAQRHQGIAAADERGRAAFRQ